MRVLVSYSDGSQKVELDDGQVVILSSPYSNGERKLYSENGQDLGYLTSQYPNGHKTARMKDGSEYDVSEKPHWFSGSRENWQKYKQGRTEELTFIEKEQIQQNINSDTFSGNPADPQEDDSAKYAEDIANEKEETDDYHQNYVATIKVEKNDEKEIADLKESINRDNRILARHQRTKSININKQYKTKSKQRHRELEICNQWTDISIKEESKRIEIQEARLNFLLEQQKIKDRRLFYLAIGLRSDLYQFYGISTMKWDTSFSKFNITPPTRHDGSKSYDDGDILIKVLSNFMEMPIGYPKGWKYTEYLLKKMGITIEEMVASRELLKALKEKLRRLQTDD